MRASSEAFALDLQLTRFLYIRAGELSDKIWPQMRATQTTTPKIWYPRFCPRENSDRTGRAEEPIQASNLRESDIRCDALGVSEEVLTQAPIKESQEVLVAAVTPSRYVEGAYAHVGDNHILRPFNHLGGLSHQPNESAERFTHGKSPSGKKQPPLVQSRPVTNKVKDNE